jgi:adenine-specific DNA-methyltransferase
MILKQLNPRKALNKAFLKVKPNRTDIEVFKSNLMALLDRTNDTESEEFHKNLVSDFLKKTYYEPNHFINTKGRNDLVIHNGDKASSTVGVILEAKKPTNKGEMIAAGNINKKAFQELVLYYLRERITHKNLEVKYLIITNINEWFIFDATTFDRLFAQNKALVGQFTDFEEGRLSETKTDFFYKQIAEPFIAKISAEIEFTYFNLQDYQKPLRNDDPSDDHKLIALFKLLSPEHLLKKPFANDSNSLDKRFYSELLHIIGLTETKEGGKKLIQRNKENDRNTGSILEDAIIQLDSLDKLSRLSNLNQFGSTTQDRLFNVALELSITWINRILFLKLLEAQLLSYNNGDASYAFLNFERIKSYDDLNSLFFQVLARKHDDRNADVKNTFAQVPYLNSSLFEPTEIEQEALFISNLSHDKQLPILSNTVLKDQNGKKRSGKLGTLEYLFEFLNAYDFGAEGSEEIQEDNKTLINASVLGLIFEKINGYKDGSFFTPGFITMYMCRETIRKAVVQKFNEAFSVKHPNIKKSGVNVPPLEGAQGEDSPQHQHIAAQGEDPNPSHPETYSSFTDVYNAIGSRRDFSHEEAAALVNAIKICDPAVGSGHFLVSALNEMIAVKHELGILADREGKFIRDYDIAVENDELVITDANGALFEYKPNNKESQRIQETLFHEKQSIIENCLFGVDINPNSVKICRLRLWIELLKNAYYTKASFDSAQPALETLPNIDINIKCGNSLVSRFAIDSDISNVLRKKSFTIEQYQIAVASYRNAKSKEEKRELVKLIDSIKENFIVEITRENPKVLKLNKFEYELGTLLAPNIFSEENIDLGVRGSKKKANEKIENLKKIVSKLKAEIEEEKNNKIFENAFEWRFEFPEVLDNDGKFVGFDVVIGNPPYIYNRDIEPTQRNFLKEKFNQADDLYVYFTHESSKLLSLNGRLAFITPNTYFTLSTREKFRQFLLGYNFQKYTYSGYCFEDAYVETMILEFSSATLYGKENAAVFVPDPQDYRDYESFEAEKHIFKNNIFNRFFIPTKINLSIHNKFKDFIKKASTTFVGELTGKINDNEQKHEYINSLKPGDLTMIGLFADGEQGLVTGNNSKYIAQITIDPKDILKINTKFYEEFRRFGVDSTAFEEFSKQLELYYLKAEDVKLQTGKPDAFGKFFIYKNIPFEKVSEFKKLSRAEQENGSNHPIWVNYYKGNSEGLTWNVPYTECILWSKEAVKELKDGIVTNSRWQGSRFFWTTGFAWVDYFTNRIKSFLVEEGIYSKNIVKLHSMSEYIPDKYVVACLNSKFVSYYVKNFITTTHTLQINDGRLIPIVVPSPVILKTIISIVDQILTAKKQSPTADTTALESEIDRLVYELYGLTEEEIKIVEGV